MISCIVCTPVAMSWTRGGANFAFTLRLQVNWESEERRGARIHRVEQRGLARKALERTGLEPRSVAEGAQVGGGVLTPTLVRIAFSVVIDVEQFLQSSGRGRGGNGRGGSGRGGKTRTTVTLSSTALMDGGDMTGRRLAGP